MESEEENFNEEGINFENLIIFRKNKNSDEWSKEN
jgi:hypothetical protein